MDIIWTPGLTTIRHEQRVEDDAIVFGSYIDGVWRESCRMVFDGNKETKNVAASVLNSVNARSRL